MDCLLLAAILDIEASSLVAAKVNAAAEPFSGLMGYILSYFYFVLASCFIGIIPGLIVAVGVHKLSSFLAINVFRAVGILSRFGLFPIVCWSLLVVLFEASPPNVEFYRYQKPDWISSWVLHHLASPQGLVMLACIWLPIYYLAVRITNNQKHDSMSDPIEEGGAIYFRPTDLPDQRDSGKD